MTSRGADPAPGLFETLGFDGTRWRFADRHRARMAASAAALGLPFDPSTFDRTLARLATGLELPALCRLDLARDGTLTVHTRPLDRLKEPLRLVFSTVRVESGDPALRHKTPRRTLYDAALAEARSRGADDGLLRNEHGRVTETSRFSVFVEDGQAPLRTPPVCDGLLPGVLRAHLLASGAAVEAPLEPADLVGASLWVGNGARGLLRAVLVEE